MRVKIQYGDELTTIKSYDGSFEDYHFEGYLRDNISGELLRKVPNLSVTVWNDSSEEAFNPDQPEIRSFFSFDISPDWDDGDDVYIIDDKYNLIQVPVPFHLGVSTIANAIAIVVTEQI